MGYCRVGGFGSPVDYQEMADFTNRAERRARLHDGDLSRGWRQELAATLDHRFAVAVGEESEMSDLDEAAGEHVQEEAADELDGLQGHLLDLIVVLRVSPAEADPTIFQAQQATVGNRDAMGVSRQIPQNLLWTAKRWLGVSHPLLVPQSGHQFRETDWVCQFSNASIERKAVRCECFFQKSEKLATK